MYPVAFFTPRAKVPDCQNTGNYLSHAPLPSSPFFSGRSSVNGVFKWNEERCRSKSLPEAQHSKRSCWGMQSRIFSPSGMPGGICGNIGIVCAKNVPAPLPAPKDPWGDITLSQNGRSLVQSNRHLARAAHASVPLFSCPSNILDPSPLTSFLSSKSQM